MPALTETPPQTESDDQAREPQGRRRRQSQQPANAVPLNIAELETKTREGLIVIAEEMGVEGASTLRKPDLIFKLLQSHLLNNFIAILETQRKRRGWRGGKLALKHI